MKKRVLKSQSKKSEKAALDKDLTATYNDYKEFEGRRYTGMKIGRRHKWHYDQGVWEEKKITPDEWEINYNVTKRRAGQAPEGSGVPVGTGYHWYIVGHQNVTKLDANTYSTSLVGLKFKLAHKRAEKSTWSASRKAQRKHTIQILKSIVKDLEAQQREEDNKIVPIRPKKVSQMKKSIGSKNQAKAPKG